MNKILLLREIKEALQELLRQTQNLTDESRYISPIDKDLLLEKTRRLYEKMLALEKEEEHTIETGTENENVSEETLPFSEKEEYDKSYPSEEKVDTGTEPQKENVVKEEKQEKQEKPMKAKEKPAPVPQKEQTTTLDLFSAVAEETLGETLKSTNKPAVADTLKNNTIHDLREAIGINDKFLFINELFNGDLERYNKVIDELNEFSGLSGAQTYLTELQIQYQWEEKSPAYTKLHELLHRKFN